MGAYLEKWTTTYSIQGLRLLTNVSAWLMARGMRQGNRLLREV